jgi:hypothetical protein
MSDGIIITIITQIVVLILGYLKLRHDRNIDKQEIKKKEDNTVEIISNRDKKMLESFKGFGDQIAILTRDTNEQGKKITQIADQFEKHNSDSEFRKDFYNAISEKAGLLINNNLALAEKPEFTDALMRWTSYLQDFGYKFYYSNYRKTNGHIREKSNELKQYLELDMNSAVSRFDIRLQSTIKAKKVYQVNSRMIEITFSEYLKTTNFYKKCELLVSRLHENGINNEKMIDIFTDYIESFIIEFMKAVKGFRGLMDYEQYLRKEID